MAAKNQNGVALIMTLILLLILSVMAVSFLFMARAETWSGMNYRLMTQARYGAEAGINKAANFLQSTSYTAPTAAQAATLGITHSPVTYGISGDPAALSANSSLGASNYPIDSDKTNFAALSGSLTSGNTTVNYQPYAKLLGIESFVAYPSSTSVVTEKWELTSDGTISGVRNAAVRVSAIMERQKVPTFGYAAFADATGCGALNFGGGGTTDSYDSSTLTTDANGIATAPSTFSSYGGNVGTNGNLDESGAKTTINGSLSTPRTGTGTCSTSTVTALTTNGNATVTQGLVELPQNLTYTTPDAPSPAPPTTAMSIANKADCTGIPSCTTDSGKNPTETYITAGSTKGTATSLGSLTVQGDLHLVPPAGTTPGTTVYINANSITANGNPNIYIDPIPGTSPAQYAQIVLNIAPGGSIDLTGSSLSNPSLVPGNFQLLYGGSNQVKINGGTQTAMVLYAPNASFKLNGGGNLYGSVIANTVTDLGGGAIHYDRHLQSQFYQLGSYMLSAFSWAKY
jgi:Tfp pilus assembly protein PilX